MHHPIRYSRAENEGWMLFHKIIPGDHGIFINLIVMQFIKYSKDKGKMKQHIANNREYEDVRYI